MSFAALFEPFRLGTLDLPNRILMAPMSRYVSPRGVPTREFADYHRRRAEGGVGLIVTGATGIARVAANNDPDLAHFHGDALPAWRQVVEEVQGAGGRIALQLWHAGSAWNRKEDFDPGGPVESPSGTNGPGKAIGQAMSENDIADTIDAFARAAADARTMGFDAVEIHGAHGFLIDQFFWAQTNLRVDHWGGETVRARTRFGTEVIRAVRRAVGSAFPISMRISQWKAQDFAARPVENAGDLEAWLAPLADAGVDLFHCSQRRFWDPEFEGSDLNLAGWVRKLTGKPTITVGSVGLDSDFFSRGGPAMPASLDEMMRRLERGDFDLVAVGRALLGDPDWAAKIRDGRTNELRPVGREARDTLY